MKRFLVLVIFLLLLVVPFTANWAPIISRQVNKSCSDCELQLDKAALRLFPLRFEIKDGFFRQGKKEILELRFRARELSAPISLGILAGHYHFGRVQVRNLAVEVIVGAEPSVDSPPGKPVDFSVEEIGLKNCQFQYRELFRGGEDGLIRLDQIEGKISGFGTLGDWAKQNALGEVTARLEQSGKVNLRVEALLFGESPDVTVNLKVEGQKLPELNSYLFPSNGLKLVGQLRDGKALVVVKGDKLEADVEVIYDGLDVLFSSHRDRSEGVAFLSNFLRGLKIDDKNTGEAKKDQRQKVTIVRDKKESVVSFILRGLKDGAFGIAVR